MDQTNEGWISWEGFKCPVSPDTRVDVRFYCGVQDLSGLKAGEYGWATGEHPGPFNIVAYRLHQPETVSSLRAVRIEAAAQALLDQLKGKRFNDGTAGAIAELRKALKS